MIMIKTDRQQPQDAVESQQIVVLRSSFFDPLVFLQIIVLWPSVSIHLYFYKNCILLYLRNTYKVSIHLYFYKNYILLYLRNTFIMFLNFSFFIFYSKCITATGVCQIFS
jgi:hypothetical protein